MACESCTSPKTLRIVFLVVLLALATVYFDIHLNQKRIYKAAVHFSRPFVDRRAPQTQNEKLVVNYGFLDKNTCKSMYGLQPRVKPVQVFDCMLFDFELDLLEIHLNELADVVTKFVIVESPVTFTLKPKPLHFTLAKSEPRFARFLPQIHHIVLDQASMTAASDAWAREGLSRATIHRALRSLHLQPHDLVLMTDVDEIVRAPSLNLLRTCAFPTDHFPMRLLAANFAFSFEWQESTDWRSIVVHEFAGTYSLLSRYTSPKSVLPDAAWHCSWCFPRLADFVHKMEAYAHTEHNQPEFKEIRRVQNYICSGKDLFDRWGERYTVKELLRNWDGELTRRLAVWDVPRTVVREAMLHGRLKYLLPGHCKRVDYPESK